MRVARVAIIFMVVGSLVNLINTWYYGWNIFLFSEAAIDGLAGLLIGIGIGMYIVIHGIDTAESNKKFYLFRIIDKEEMDGGV